MSSSPFTRISGRAAGADFPVRVRAGAVLVALVLFSTGLAGCQAPEPIDTSHLKGGVARIRIGEFVNRSGDSFPHRNVTIEFVPSVVGVDNAGGGSAGGAKPVSAKLAEISKGHRQALNLALEVPFDKDTRAIRLQFRGDGTGGTEGGDANEGPYTFGPSALVSLERQGATDTFNLQGPAGARLGALTPDKSAVTTQVIVNPNRGWDMRVGVDLKLTYR